VIPAPELTSVAQPASEIQIGISLMLILKNVNESEMYCFAAQLANRSTCRAVVSRCCES